MTAHEAHYTPRFAPRETEYHRIIRVFLDTPPHTQHEYRSFKFELVQHVNPDGSSSFSALVWHRSIPVDMSPGDVMRVPWRSYGSRTTDVTEQRAVSALYHEWSSVCLLTSEQVPNWEAPENPFLWPELDPWIQYQDGSREWEGKGIPDWVDDVACGAYLKKDEFPRVIPCVRRGPKSHGLFHATKEGRTWAGEWVNPYGR